MTRPAAYVGILVLCLGLGTCWFKARDNRLRREAVAAEHVQTLEAEIQRRDRVIAGLRVEVATRVAATDTVIKYVTTATNSYTRQRADVDTSRAAQPSGTPEGSVVVPREFVAAADSLAAQVPTLLQRLEAERRAYQELLAAGDSTTTLLRAEVRELKVLVATGRQSHRTRDRLLGAVAGGLVVYAASRL